MIEYVPLTPADLPLLHAWLARPHVAEWWGSPSSLEELEREYRGSAKGGTRVCEDAPSDECAPFIAYLDGEPLGFIQSYRVMGSDPGWWEEETDPHARGIDQFLANASQLGRGLGSRMVAEFIARIFEDERVTKVQTDPDPANTRAIRAYEKAGFRAVREVITPDGPALLMVVTRVTGCASTKPARRRP